MQRNTSPVFRLLGTVFGLTLLVSLIVVILGSVFHWNTSVQFSNGFFAAGALVVVLGLFSVAGGFQLRANFPLAYAESVSDASLAERGKRMMADINQRYGAVILLVSTGLLLIGIAILIPQIF